MKRNKVSPLSKLHFALSVGSDCISDNSVCILSSTLATSNVNDAKNNAN